MIEAGIGILIIIGIFIKEIIINPFLKIRKEE